MIVFHLCRLSRSSRLRLLADLDDPAAMEAIGKPAFGTKRTNRAGLMMSIVRGRAEAIGTRCR
jgi:hypothetical protein